MTFNPRFHLENDHHLEPLDAPRGNPWAWPAIAAIALCVAAWWYWAGL